MAKAGETSDMAVQVALSSPSNDVQAQLSAILLRRMKSEELAEQELAAQRHKGLLQMAEQTKRAEAEKDAERAQCGHRKPDGRSCIGGQWDANRTLHLICLYCQKEFNEVPAGHHIDRTLIGGPQG
jgi:hypothetical protein